MTHVLTSRRWQIAWWGNFVVGVLLSGGCAALFSSGHSSLWLMASLFVAYVCGFLAAVLVEIGTQ